MISAKTIEIVKATAPILQEHGETLTRHFYKRMFAHNPEVLPFFNPAHQESGGQQKALAAAVCAYAANIDNLQVLGGAVELIAQKHVSLQIKPEHYPIVGSNLLASIREVLGEGATDDVINAWAEAYGALAGILTGREAQLYKEQKDAPNGWNDFKPFKVVAKEKESSVITSFYLAPADGSGLPSFKAGQYLTVQVPSPCGHRTMRNYSLSDKPGLDHFRISVKRENGPKADTPKGFVSNLLHDSVQVGDVLSIAAPCGEFFLNPETDQTKPLVLLAGGIGVTPILSILLSALETTPDRKILMAHASLDENTQAFRKTLDALAASHNNLTVRHFYSDPTPAGMERAVDDVTGFLDIQSLSPDADADYYFCGPKPFMVEVYHQLLNTGIAPARLHFEFFGPKDALERKAA